MGLLRVIMARSNGFLFVSQQTSFDGVGHPVKAKAGVDETAFESSADVHHATCLWTLQLFSHLQALLSNNSFYTLSGDKRLEWKAVRQPQFTTPALFTSLLSSAMKESSCCRPKHQLGGLRR